MTAKHEALLELAHRRQADRLDGYANVGDFHAGGYEADYVSPWSISAHNTDSPILLVAQDWASVNFLAGPFQPEIAKLGHDPRLMTNRNLESLLQRRLGRGFADVYATNLFPFIKPGGMSARIPQRHMSYAAESYLLPQIDILCPCVVVTLGEVTANALRAVLGQPKLKDMGALIESDFTAESVAYFALAHPGTLGTNNRGREQVEKDWQRLANRLDKAKR